MRIARSVSVLTLCLAAPLWLAGCETRVGGFSRALAPGPAGPAETASLTALNVSGTTLDPSFSASTTTYTASVSNAVQSVTITPTASAGTAITINGTPVNSGAATPIVLAEGSNTVTVGASNTAGLSTTYTVTITRAAGSP